MTPDARDLAAARAGDDTAFARLHDRHGPVVLSLCRRRSLAEAEDAAQETFIRAFRKLHQVDRPEGLRPWLYAIARRVCSERNRARQRRAVHQERFGMISATSAVTSNGAENAERRSDLRRLGDALEQLDDRERLAIHLHYLETDPVQAASAALGLSRSGYYKLLERARRRLAAIMNTVKAS